MREKISACVTAGNEEENIRRCLESLRWCDEIVVVDSFSDDRTVEICKEYTDRVYQHEWLGYIGQKNLIRGMASYSWIFFLDADEEVTEELRDEILKEFEKGTGQYVCYSFPRRVFYLGKWIMHGEWYPDVKLRLFKKEHGRSAGREPHDHVVVDGPVKRMKNPINHYTYKNVREHLATMNRFTSITAQEKFREGTRFRMSDWLFRPVWRFFKAFFFRGGFLDGRRGFMIAMVSSFAVAMKYAKLWELELEEKGLLGSSPDGD
jgi:glycosyltransferase involved in cell wall biosynthesis